MNSTQQIFLVQLLQVEGKASLVVKHELLRFENKHLAQDKHLHRSIRLLRFELAEDDLASGSVVRAILPEELEDGLL